MKLSSLSLKALILAPLFAPAMAQAALFKLEPYGYITCSNADQSQRIVVARTHLHEQTLTVRSDDGRVVEFELSRLRLKVTRSMILSVQVIPGDVETAEISRTRQNIAAEIEISGQDFPGSVSSYICEKTTFADID